MSTIELAERLRGTPITVNAVHPGIVNTHMLKSATGIFKLIALLATPVAVSPERGAATTVYLATSPDVANRTACSPATVGSMMTAPDSPRARRRPASS